MKKSIAVLSVLYLVSGCTSLPSKEKMQEEVQGFQLPLESNDTQTRVFVIRPSSLGALIRFNVFLDSQADTAELGYTRGGQHIFFYVTPGHHKVFSKAENWEAAEFDAKTGEDVYIEQEPEIGFFIARNSLKFVNELEGKYQVKHTSIGTIHKK